MIDTYIYFGLLYLSLSLSPKDSLFLSHTHAFSLYQKL